MTGLKDLLRIERARHFLVALAIAATLGVTGFLNPIESLIWASHARTLEREASGQIVFIGGVDDLADPTRPERRRTLATLINKLTASGAHRVFLDVRLDEGSEAAADNALRRSLEQSDRTYLVDRFQTTVTGPRMLSTIPAVSGSSPRVVARQRLDLFGWTWAADQGSIDAGRLRQSFAGGLAGIEPSTNEDFRIDYSINYRSVPSMSIPEAFSAFRNGKGRALFENKFVVIGNGGGPAAYTAIPGDRKVPASMVAILAGETLRAGSVIDIGWEATFLIFGTLLACAVFISRKTSIRYGGYVFVVALVPTWFFVTAYVRMAAYLSVPIALLLIYGTIRAWHLRSRSLIDELSGMPNFQALERDLARQASLTPKSVIVARIHRFDEVLAILPPERHGEYVRQVAERFRIAEKDLTVYSNAGRYLAWLQEEDDAENLEAHLQGLRAVFANPLYVDGTAIDVGITFGVDATHEASPSRKIASATAAVDRTTESHSPVQHAVTSSVSDRMWNVSLQSKIDAALKGGQIYVVYQPQFDLETETPCGFEALVRWSDPERGSIAPSYFIEQCEHAGRMEALTRKVFTEAADAIGNSTFSEGSHRLSVNVSATMLGDDRVIDILEQTLAHSSLDAKRFTIEITETARIPDFDRARTVLDRIRTMGVRTSIDDFGVGAANLETLLRLPFDELKIDRAFISRIKDDAKARQIAESLIDLGKGIGLDVVAEGVEDQFTLEILRSLGCSSVQGFLLGKPAALSAFEKRLMPGMRAAAAPH